MVMANGSGHAKCSHCGSGNLEWCFDKVDTQMGVEIVCLQCGYTLYKQEVKEGKDAGTN